MSKLQNIFNEKSSEYSNNVRKFEKLSQTRKQLDEINSEIATYEAERNVLDSEITNLQSCISEQNRELAKIDAKISDISDTITKGKNEDNSLVTKLTEIREKIEKLEKEKIEENLSIGEENVAKLEWNINVETTNRNQLEEKIRTLEQSTTEVRNLQRNIEDNRQYLKYKKRIEELNSEIQKFELRLYSLNCTNTKNRLKYLKEICEGIMVEIANHVGRKKELEEAIKRTNIELETNFKDIEKRYREQDVIVYTSELAIGDLVNYAQALDKAIICYHASKMKEINTRIRDLWSRTYSGKDIEAIEIRADIGSSNTVKRSHNYRIIMIQKGIEVDMRAKSSAGQRMLASIVIRLALAQSFCVNFGALALDEPTTNLDEDNIQNLARSLRTLLESQRHNQNFQLIIITHDENFSRLVGDTEYSDFYYSVRKNSTGVSVIEKRDWRTYEE